MEMTYVAAINEERESKDVLGYLCWYSVGEDLYEREQLKKKFRKAGLPESYLPNPIRATDAFKRATKSIERLNIQTDEGVSENYLVRNVLTNSKIVQRNLVKEIRDPKGKRLIYDAAVAEFVLHREDETFVIQKRPNGNGLAEELVEEAEKLYQLYLSHHNASAVRRAILAILKSMSPTPVRPSGGVYFVPAKHYSKLSSMIQFLKSLDRGEGIMIPLIDTRENRDMIKEKLLDHLKQTLMNCHVLLRNPKAQKVQIQTMIEDARQIIKDFNEYREIITGSMEEMENQIELIKQQIQLLLEKELAS